MLRIIRFIFLVYFVQISFQAFPTTKRNDGPKNVSNPRNMTGRKESLQINTSTKSSTDNNDDDEDATFHPDTLLIDFDKVAQDDASTSNNANVKDNSSEHLIPLDEAMKMANYSKTIVKPGNYTFHIPKPTKILKIPPHDYSGAKNGLDLVSRKLFVRREGAPNSPSERYKKAKGKGLL